MFHHAHKIVRAMLKLARYCYFFPCIEKFCDDVVTAHARHDFHGINNYRPFPLTFWVKGLACLKLHATESGVDPEGWGG